MISAYHAKYYARELTRRHAVDGVDRLSQSLFDASVDLNPHQIDAALFALKNPLQEGVLLADEVGLGKTIEASLVVCQYWAERRRRLLIICPASLRKQWAQELNDKFAVPTIVVDAISLRKQSAGDMLASLQRQVGKAVFIMSYQFAAKLEAELRAVPWDVVVVATEIAELNAFVDAARALKTDTKAQALLKAIDLGFGKMAELRAPRKAIIFTESKRTQEYLHRFLAANGHAGNLVLFSGTNNHEESTVIYQRWLEEYKGTDRVTGSPQVDRRTALIDHFRKDDGTGAEIMIATEAAAEGVNLQFCALIINYDLPWNPQRVEQRIGRCHRYGRLKGKGFSLKRTLPQDRPKGVHLDKLEALNIFGVRANYMAAFKDYLREEGITPSDEVLELDFPTRANLPKGKLKTLALKDGYKDNQRLGFKRTHFPWLYEIPAQFQGKIKYPHVTLDLYPRVEALSSKDKGTDPTAEARNKAKLNQTLFPAFDWDRIYLALQDFKLKRSWSNLRLERQKLIDFCSGKQDWYTLFIPAAELNVTSFAAIRKQEDILLQLLTDYTDRFYKALKTGYEGQFYDITHIDEDHGSMLKLYQFEIENSDDGLEYQAKLEVLKKLVADGKIGEASKWNAPHMVAISFDRHLYYPLLSLEDKDAVPLKLRPLAFDAPSEWEFVRDLEAFYNSAEGKEAIGPRSLYLLRNADREEKGLGFALAGNFYPDFLLWLVDDASGKQWLTFVDPKGLRNLDLSHPKLGLHKEVKTLEATLAAQGKAGEAPLVLNAFVLSATKFADLLNVGDPAKKTDLESRNVLFMEEGGKVYLKKLFSSLT